MRARFLHRSELTGEDREAMLALLDEHFEGVDAQVFRSDLDSKTHVVLLDDEGVLSGFSTLAIECRELDGDRVAVVYSGDTIVRSTARASGLLPKAWVRGVLGQTEALDVERTLWLLIVSGWRTYRLLPTFLNRFAPRFDVPWTEEERRQRDLLASARFGSRFDRRTGIVRLASPQPLRPGVGDVPAERRDDPHVRHFLDCNPQHQRGDELACLAELSIANLNAAGRRALGLPRESRL